MFPTSSLQLMKLSQNMETHAFCTTGDFVMAFAGCACSLENVMIKRAYGQVGYGVVLFTTAFWFYMTVKDGSRGNPVAHMMAYMKGEMRASMMLTRMAFQLMGGLSSYRYARYFWYLEFTKVCSNQNSKLKLFRITCKLVNIINTSCYSYQPPLDLYMWH